MKKYSIFSLLLLLPIVFSACEDDKTLDETRPAQTTLATIETVDATVDMYDLSFTGKLNNEGGSKVVEMGLLISQEAQPTLQNSTIIASKDSVYVGATYTVKASLLPSTTYYVCGYALSANGIATSQAKSFTTQSHPLSPFLGNQILSAQEFYAEEVVTIQVTNKLVAGTMDQMTVSGLKSFAGVDLNLAPLTLEIDVKNNTVTIPAGQAFNEKLYGPYQYVRIVEQDGDLAIDSKNDIMGHIENGTIILDDYIGAMIIDGGNKGLFHTILFDATIGNAPRSATMSPNIRIKPAVSLK